MNRVEEEAAKNALEALSQGPRQEDSTVSKKDFIALPAETCNME
jgi:hypothetical protein